jgi:hypothetical protein
MASGERDGRRRRWRTATQIEYEVSWSGGFPRKRGNWLATEGALDVRTVTPSHADFPNQTDHLTVKFRKKVRRASREGWYRPIEGRARTPLRATLAIRTFLM